MEETLIEVKLNRQELEDICESIRQRVHQGRLTPEQHYRISKVYETLSTIQRQKPRPVIPGYSGDPDIQPKVTPEYEEPVTAGIIITEPKVRPVQKITKSTKHVKPKHNVRQCVFCKSTKTYMYKGNPRWHFIGKRTYCHTCYSKVYRRPQ